MILLYIYENKDRVTVVNMDTVTKVELELPVGIDSKPSFNLWLMSDTIPTRVYLNRGAEKEIFDRFRQAIGKACDGRTMRVECIECHLKVADLQDAR